jgi:hypothetical protein
MEENFTIEEAARNMASELLSVFSRADQARVWMMVKQYLISDAEEKRAAEKQAEQNFKKMR